MMIVEIITALKNAGLNAVAFGDTTPTPPYTVVKPEKDEPLLRGTVYRVTNHVAKGFQIQLDENVQTVVSTLSPILEYGEGDFNPTPFTGNSDETISRETTFLLVSKY